MNEIFSASRCLAYDGANRAGTFFAFVAAMPANTDQPELLAGLVERVTFHNEENGFCVLRVKARGHKELVTTIGHAATITAGEWLTASGTWHNDRTHGLQFRAKFLKTSAPSTLDGIEKYLSSGMIRGILRRRPSTVFWRPILKGVASSKIRTIHWRPTFL